VKAVPEESGGGDVDGEVERFPDAAAEADAEVGRGDYDGDDVKRDGADGVLERLARGMDGIEENRLRGILRICRREETMGWTTASERAT